MTYDNMMIESSLEMNWHFYDILILATGISFSISSATDKLSPFKFWIDAVKEFQIIGRSVRSWRGINATRFPIEHKGSFQFDNPRIGTRWFACRGRHVRRLGRQNGDTLCGLSRSSRSISSSHKDGRLLLIDEEIFILARPTDRDEGTRWQFDVIDWRIGHVNQFLLS